MRTTAQSRLLCMGVLLAASFTVFSFRLIYLQVARHDDYAALAAEKHTNKVTIHARRGAIYDARGEPLAQNEPVKKVVADGSLIKDRAALAALLAGPLDLPESVLIQKLSREYSKTESKRAPLQYIPLKKQVAESAAAEISTRMAAAKMRGIIFEQESTRVYPNAKMLCHVLGYLFGGVGTDGIERTFDRFLSGQDGFRYIERDGSGREIVQFRGAEVGARDGSSVRLTIDMSLQNIVETELEIACRLYRPKSGTAILMEPHSGAILALANFPNFDPNKPSGAPEDHRRNRAITDQVEPGSTFKTVAASSALDLRLVTPETPIKCENGYWADYKLHDHAPYAELCVHDVLVRSSNIGAAKLAMRLGDEKFFEYVRRFGYGERTGIDLPGEVSGVVHLPQTWSKLSLSRMAMGHEVSATPLQIATAMSVIANGGRLMMPQIAKEIVGADGKIVSTFPAQEVRRVVSQRATDAVRDALLEVVSPKGTASAARVFGYKVAGKTGTAQKTDKDGRYSHDKYVSSFVGYMPADNPAFVGIVIFDEPHTKPGQSYGGLVAAPIFSRIGEKAARYLGLTPTEDRAQGEKGATIAGQAPLFRDQ